MASLAGELSRGPSRSAWLTARARNAVSRPHFIAIVGGAIFIAALAALVLAPQQLRRGAKVLTGPTGPRPDTSMFSNALDEARRRLAAAEASLAKARLAPPSPQVQEPIIPPAILTQRDSLSNAVSDLDALLTRAEGAPVTASYRALAESPQLTSNPRIRVLLDSLAEVEREREGFGTTGGADPVYLALTSRATEIGRAIQSIAQERRDAIRGQIASLNVPAQRPTVVSTTTIDTAGWVAERDSARSLVEQASGALGDARRKASDFDQDAARARRAAAEGAPPAALLGAALIIGIALGFGVAFVGELRHPRISDAHEAERVTGVRVLATVRPRPRDPDRMRRSTDRLMPPYFDPAAAAYQLTYLHLARTGASRLVLTVVSADPKIANLTKEIQVARGKQVFMQTCFVCHQPNGEGIPNQIPPLAKSDFLMADAERSIRIVLQGRSGEVEVNGKKFNGTMVPLNNLTDEEIANVLTYVRNSFGNSGEPVIPGTVRKIRSEAPVAAPSSLE